MAYREMLAWIMLVAVGIAGWSYYKGIRWLSEDLGVLASPSVPGLIRLAIMLVVMIAAGHILAALIYRLDNNNPPDERERRIIDRASSASGLLLGGGVVTAGSHYLFFGNGDQLFYGVLASLVLAQMAESFLQIVGFRWR